MVITALIIIAKIWKQPKCPSVDEWIKQLWDTYTMEYYSAGKKKKMLPFATAWTGLDSIMLSEIGQSEKDRSNDFTHERNLNKQTGLPSRIQTDSQRDSRMTAVVGMRWWRDRAKRKKDSGTWTTVW